MQPYRLANKHIPKNTCLAVKIRRSFSSHDFETCAHYSIHLQHQFFVLFTLHAMYRQVYSRTLAYDTCCPSNTLPTISSSSCHIMLSTKRNNSSPKLA